MKKKLNVKEILLDSAPAIAAGVVAGVGTYIGYKVGWKDCTAATTKGIAKAWEADPTLREHMWDVAEKIGRT